MSEEQGFLKQLAAEPGDDVTRLVYADWLEERGDARGAFLRAEMALAALSEADADFAQSEGELLESMKSLDPAWLEAAGKRWDVWLTGYSPEKKIASIKVLRELTNCGLGEAKRRVEALPSHLISSVSRIRAEAVRTRFIRALYSHEGHLPPFVTFLMRSCPAPAAVAYWPFDPAFEVVVSNHAPRRKRAMIEAIAAISFYPEDDIGFRLDSGQPFTIRRYDNEAEARAAADSLLEFGRAEVRPIERQPVPTAEPLAPPRYRVRIRNYPPAAKFAVIRAIRQHDPMLTLVAARAISEQPDPIVVYDGGDAQAAQSIRQRLLDLHAVVELI